MIWTEDRVEILTELWESGMSARQVAKELGGSFTRNAVIGKVHRLGLSHRAARQAAAAAAVAAKATAQAPAAPRAKPVPVPPPRRPIVPAGQPLPPQPSVSEISPEALAKVRKVERKARKISLMELTERTCKWPIGDPATASFWFCGLPTQPGKPYCEAHTGVAFQPPNPRRDRRR